MRGTSCIGFWANPFDTSMLIGAGHGEVNGITAGLQSEDGIAFNQGFGVTGKDEDWR